MPGTSPLITRLTQDLVALLKLRPDIDLESLDHATGELPFDLGIARDNKEIHNRSGDRIFITALTGVAYIQTRPQGVKYKLRIGSISLPFKKLYLTNTAQAGKSLSLIIGFGAFVDFAAELLQYGFNTPITYNVEMTDADTEYSRTLPANTLQLTFKTIDGTAFRYAWVTGKVATPTAPYTPVPTGAIVFIDKINLTSKTLYFACSAPGKILDMEVIN